MDNGEHKSFYLGFISLPGLDSKQRGILVSPAPAGWGFFGERFYILPQDLRTPDNSFLSAAVGDGQFGAEDFLGADLVIANSSFDPRFLAIATYHARANAFLQTTRAANFGHLFVGLVGILISVDGNSSFVTTSGWFVLEGVYKRLTSAERILQAQRRKSDVTPITATTAHIWRA